MRPTSSLPSRKSESSVNVQRSGPVPRFSHGAAKADAREPLGVDDEPGAVPPERLRVSRLRRPTKTKTSPSRMSLFMFTRTSAASCVETTSACRPARRCTHTRTARRRRDQPRPPAGARRRRRARGLRREHRAVHARCGACDAQPRRRPRHARSVARAASRTASCSTRRPRARLRPCIPAPSRRRAIACATIRAIVGVVRSPHARHPHHRPHSHVLHRQPPRAREESRRRRTSQEASGRGLTFTMRN